MRAWVLGLLLLEACGAVDADRDGWSVEDDCDDADAAVNPDAVEVCNDLDDDCDGLVDPPNSEGTQVIWQDKDDDGYGDEENGPVKACDRPPGWVSVPGDCDDDDPATNDAAGNCP